MLANLPAKRSTRKLISLHEGIYRARKTTQNIKQNKVKCGKVIYKSSTRKETTEKTINTVSNISKSQIGSSSSRRSLRNLNKVLASRILDTNLNVKRKMKVLNERRKTRQFQLEQENCKEIVNDETVEKILLNDSGSTTKPRSKILKKDDAESEDTQSVTKRSSPRSSPKNLKKKMSVKKMFTGKINIKSFFPVKKKNRKILTENQNPQDVETTEIENTDIKTRSKRKLKEPCDAEEEKKVPIKKEQKKSKHETFSTLVRSLSLRKKKLAKKAVQDRATEKLLNNSNTKQQSPVLEKSEEDKKINIQNSQELKKAVKKRKLKSSFRNVINKVKKLKIDNPPENVTKVEELKLNLKIHKESAFLEEGNLEVPSAHLQTEKVIIPSISEPKENTADISANASTAINFHDNNENPPIPETIFKLELNNEKNLQAKGELDFDTHPMSINVNKSSDSSAEEDTKIEISCKKNSTAIETADKTLPISIETSVKPKIVPLISPNMKGKIRKPTRGLNECIAMLTSKVQQKSVEENSNKADSIFHLLSPNKPPPPFRESYPPKTECILRIPTYRSQMTYPEIEETALDLSTKSLRNKEIPEKEEPFRKGLDIYKRTIRYSNDTQTNKNFVLPTFDRKLTKAYNSVDRIIEEVVENRIHTVFPEIQQKKWNSVDDIIQKVIDDQRSQLKVAARNSVDEIIDFVVEYGRNSDNKGNEIKTNVSEHLMLNKELTIRKIGSIRKNKNKKSSVETENLEGMGSDVTAKVIATVAKEPLENISIMKSGINISTENLSNTVLPKNACFKKKNKSKKVVNNVEVESRGTVTETPTIAAIVKTIENVREILKDKNRTQEEISSSSKENSLQNAKIMPNLTDSPQKVDLHLNNAVIDTVDNVEVIEKNCTEKAKKGSRKVGQVRNRSQIKKATKANIGKSGKIIETNIDSLLDIKEIKSNPVLEYCKNVFVTSDSVLTKSNEIKQLSNEDEPHLLENKPVALEQKPSTLASDSEDDIPLATLAKSDEKGANLTKLMLNNKNLNEIPSCAEKATEKQNAQLVNVKVTENKYVDKNKMELISDSNINNRREISTTQGPTCSKVSQKEEANQDAKIKEHIIVSIEIEDKYINKEKCTSKLDIEKNTDNDNTKTKKIHKTETKINKDSSNVNKKQSQINDVFDANLSSITEILKPELDKPITDIVDNTEKLCMQNNIPDDKVLNKCHDNSQTSSVENTCLLNAGNKASPKSFFNKKEEIAIDFEMKRNIRRTKPLSQQTTGISKSLNDLVQEKLVSAANESIENTLNLPESLSDVAKISPIDPKKELIKEIDENSSKLICFLEKDSTTKKPKGKTKTTESLLNDIVLSAISSETKTEELTVQLKPLLTQCSSKAQKVMDFKRKSDFIIEDNIKHMLELKPILGDINEFSSKTKTKALKSKGKTKLVKSKLHAISKFSNRTTEDFEDQKVEPLDKVPNKELKSKWNQNLLMEDEIPLKNLYQNVCNEIAKSDKALYESEETDKEIENILFSSLQDIKPRSRASSSKNKTIKNYLEGNIIGKKSYLNDSISSESIEPIEKSRQQSSPKKSRRKSLKIKGIENISDCKYTKMMNGNKEATDKNIKAVCKENNDNDISLETTKSSENTSPIDSKVDIISNETPKGLKQPLMKNLEISLELTDVKKSVLLHSNNKNTKSKDEIYKSNEHEISTGKKQAKSINKKSETDSNFIRSSFEPFFDKANYIGEELADRILNRSEIDMSNKSKPPKNKTALNITSQDQLITIDIISSSPIDVVSEEIKNKNNISRLTLNEAIHIQGIEKNTDLNHILNESTSLSNTETILKDIEPEIQLEQSYYINSQLTVKQKVKHNKHSAKTSKRAKSKPKRTSEIIRDNFGLKRPEKDISTSTERVPILNAIDVLVENTNPSADKEINKTIDVVARTRMKENADENVSNKINEEPPIKIVINKQKTRRKSKSFKKIDLKGQNDLFEDFALVIKKPKRVTSIIAFTPADTFSKEVYPNFLKMSSEEPLHYPKTCNENEEADDTFAELDSSVEEMDMELDEIPITSNIIERDKSFLPSVADVFTKPDVEILVETLNELENEKQKDKDEDKIVEDNMKGGSVEELLLSSEKDLTLPTEAEVEEFLYETNRRSTRNRNIEKQDTESFDKRCKVNSTNQSKILDDSYQIVEDLTKVDFISENVKDNTEDGISQTLTVPSSQEGVGSKVDNNAIEGLVDSCNSQNNECELNTSIVKSLNKKKKSKNSKNGKIKTLPITTERKDINAESSFSLLEPYALNKVKDNKRKRSKSTAVDETDFDKHTNKLKDIDSIYAFSESEDFEIEKPIAKPKKSPRKQTKSLSESVDIANDDLITVELLPFSINDATFKQSQKDQKQEIDYKEVIIKSGFPKRRPRSCNLSSERKIIGEIKENDINTQEEGKRSVRSAKVKALEHIHDDALAELTESERNRDLEKDKRSSIIEDIDTVEELSKKRISRRQSKCQKTQTLDGIKLSDDSTLVINDNPNLDFYEKNPVNEDVIELDNKSTNECNAGELVLTVEKESNLYEIVVQQEIHDNLVQPTKKIPSKKIKAKKINKARKSINTFQSEEDLDKFLLVKDDLSDLEELEGSIEKEFNVDIELRTASKQLIDNSKEIEIKLSESAAEENEINGLPMEDNNQELRRSRRGSRRVTSYNENDLIDPLLDEIDGKKKIRKKEKAVLEELENKNQRKLKEPEKKLNSDELFDLLKASSTENSCVQKSGNTFLNNTVFNEHNFQNSFENILDHPSSMFKQNKCTEKSNEGKKVESIYEFTDSPEIIEQPRHNVLSSDVTRKQNKKVPRSTQIKSQGEENSNSGSITTPILDNKTLTSSTSDILELSMETKTKSHKMDKSELTNKSNYCEICNKKFIRTDNLVKHKRTLTHIQKLSEIEAKEAAQRSLSTEPLNNSSKTSNSVIEITSDSSKVIENLSKIDININDILQESGKSNRQEPVTDHTSFPNNHSLKLADIINDVLNKPVLESDNEKHNSFSDIIMQNNVDIQPEYRRYKSLGERKSFDSEPIEPRSVPISEPYVSKTTILEKQISLLENIIENQTGVNYIDDISMSSNNSLENNALVSPSELSLKQDDSDTYSRINLTKPNTNDDSFLKPSQYEEISEDSVNVRSYEDQKLRKTLNRDEELFLECCSLLKSGSEMSSYSNKKSQNKVINTMGLKQCDEPEWLERKSLVEKPLYDVGNEYSDNSRIPTPLGDSYDDDASNSNTISSNWNMNKKVNIFEDISQDKEEDANKSFSFQEILIDEEKEKNKGNISKFGGILSKTISVLPKVIKR